MMSLLLRRPIVSLEIVTILSILALFLYNCNTNITVPQGPTIHSFQILYGVPWTESGTELIVTDTNNTDSVESHFTFKGSENWLKPVDGIMTYYDEPPTQVVGVITGSKLSQTIIYFDGAHSCCVATDTVTYCDDSCSTNVWDSEYGKFRFKKSETGEEVAYFILSYGKYGFNRFSDNNANGIFTWITDLNGMTIRERVQMNVYHYLYTGPK